MFGARWIQKLFRRSWQDPPNGSSRSNWLREAKLIEKQEDWPKLIEHYRIWVKADPNYPFAWQCLGDAHQSAEQFDSAIQAYHQALDLNPHVAATWCALGHAYVRKNDVAEAIKSYQFMEGVMRNQRDDPLADNVHAWVSLALIYQELDQLESMNRAFLQAEFLTSKRQQQEFENWFAIGLAYRKIGLSEKVAEVFQRLRKLDPTIKSERFEELAAKRLLNP